MSSDCNNTGGNNERIKQRFQEYLKTREMSMMFSLIFLRQILKQKHSFGRNINPKCQSSS